MKDAAISPAKIDSILLGRLDKVRKIMETNGTFILFPPLASQRNLVRIQGLEGLHVERTVRDIMGLVSSEATCFRVSSIALTYLYRLASSIVLLGGSSSLWSLAHLRHQTLETCYLTSAPTQTLMYPSKS